MTVAAIKSALKKLPASKRRAVVRWAVELTEDDWDKQMIADAAAGKLDFLVDEAEKAAKDGKLKPFPPR